MQVLEATTNLFQGVLPIPEALPSDTTLFRQQLAHSLQVWREEGYLVVWLQLSINQAALIPIAVEAGFTFHHSDEDKTDQAAYLMLTYRLRPQAFIPPYASHYVGVGGVVLTDQAELLVVSERYRHHKDHPYYKLPGGALHPGEHIVTCAIREILEETGIRTCFERLVCFRHWHGYRYNKSDIYFVCRLTPLSHAISRQEAEIEECLWMPVQEYLNNPHVGLLNKRIVQAALRREGLGSAQIEGYDNLITHEFFMPEEDEGCLSNASRWRKD